jgi:predicted O-methyltransferase YrrM
MEFIDEKISDYAEHHTTPESPVLEKLNRETWTNVNMPRMLSGHLQGRILATFSKMINPKRILEIGTYTGYSAICLAEGLAPDGKLYTIDINEELSDMVNKYFDEAGVKDKIDFRVGNAMNIIPKLNEEFDLVFIDADKENYPNYFNLVLPLMRKGGYLITDNVLWSGKVMGNRNDMDDETKAIADFNELTQKSQLVENVLFPVRDGLMVSRKL